MPTGRRPIHVDGIIIKRNHDVQNMDIFIPIFLITLSVDQNGIELLGPLIAEVERVIDEVDASLLERVMRASDIEARFSTILSGKFIGSSIGQYVLILMMIGHHIEPERYFTGSSAKWNGISPIRVLGVQLDISSLNAKASLAIRLLVSYRRCHFQTTKSLASTYRMIF
ncbi:hypothetical protein N7540_011150 [Penicillium herquei]|nr:hypothetical protein N7540_011150 [Penicillium herquei]